MVSSKLDALVDAAWPKISTALQKGLKEKKHRLDALVTLVERSGDLRDSVVLAWSDATDHGGFSERRLSAEPATICQLRADEPLTRQDMDPDLGDKRQRELEVWAGAVRTEEHKWVLERIAEVATAAGELNDDCLKALVPAGTWRIVVFSSSEGLEAQCRAKGIELVKRDDVGLQGKAALAYRIADFAVARREDLTPSFDYKDEDILVVLSEQIELIGFPDDGAKEFVSIGTITPPP
jgi:hypothetical protein